jgi:rhamnosyltransferase
MVVEVVPLTMSSPEVSIVIPTFNAGPVFKALLDGIRAQEGDFEREIIVIDSGSTDGTVELAQRYGAVVHKIPQAEFNHGATRNLGVSLARGKYVALTVQDAVPIDERWLAAMVENLERDKRVAGVYSRQIACKESGVLTRAVVNNLALASLERREQFVGDSKRYTRMPPRKRRRLATFDDVSSCLRRSIWEEMPFERTNFGEDLRWGKRVIEAGYKIVYEPRSAVFHSHERGAIYDLRRYYVNQRLLSDLFELELVPNEAYLPLAMFRSYVHLHRLLRQEEGARGKRLGLALAVAKYVVSSQLGNYLGVRSDSLARLSPRAFDRVDRFLSKGF